MTSLPIIQIGDITNDQDTETQGHGKPDKGRQTQAVVSVQRVQGLPRIIKLTRLLYNRETFKRQCRQCEKEMELGTNIVTKKSFSANRTITKPSTKWYHVECAERLNII